MFLLQFFPSEKIVLICNPRNRRPISRQRKDAPAIVAGPGLKRMSRARLPPARRPSRVSVDVSLIFVAMLPVAYAMKKRTQAGEQAAIWLDARCRTASILRDRTARATKRRRQLRRGGIRRQNRAAIDPRGRYGRVDVDTGNGPLAPPGGDEDGAT